MNTGGEVTPALVVGWGVHSVVDERPASARHQQMLLRGKMRARVRKINRAAKASVARKTVTFAADRTHATPAAQRGEDSAEEPGKGRAVRRGGGVCLKRFLPARARAPPWAGRSVGVESCRVMVNVHDPTIRLNQRNV